MMPRCNCLSELKRISSGGLRMCNKPTYRRIIHAPLTYVFQTDASDTGWGIFCSSHDSWKSQGLWSREQGVLHINVRELYVMHICLTIFCFKLSDVHIQFELDNVTAVAYVNQMGGSKSIACDLLAHKIWSWCIGFSFHCYVTAHS